MALADIAQLILRHAETGPADKPGHRVRNTLSPSMERFIIETVRGHIIKEAQKVEKLAGHEFESLRALLPEPSRGQFDLSVARILETLRNIYQ